MATNSVYKVSNDEAKPLLSIRWIVVILLFFVNFSMFFAQNACAVALVDMVGPSGDEGDQFKQSGACPMAKNKTRESCTNQTTGGEFHWTASQQGIILSTFSWGIVITKILASRFVEVIGQRAYVGTAIAIGGTLQLLSPLASKLHPMALATVTLIEGLCYGPVWPALYSLLAVWAPWHELSSMTSTMVAGAMVGVMTGVGVSGWLTENVSWQSVFWLGGGISFTILPFWILIVRNSPKEHPWLTSYEEKLLQSTKHIKTQIGLDLSKAGLATSMRSLFGLTMMLIYGRISDFLVKNNYVRKRNARKIFHFIGTGGMGMTLIGIAFAGCDYRTVVALWVLNGALSSGSSLSYSVSVIDFAPNYAATVSGLIGFGNLGSALVPVTTAALVQKDGSWNSIFFLTAGLSALSCGTYIAFMTDEPQSWNFHGGGLPETS